MKKVYSNLARIAQFFGKPVSNLVLHNSRRVRVLVLSGDEILLQRTSLGHQKWSTPGGGVEKNEKPEAAAVREIQEEVGLTISETDLAFLGEVPTSLKRNSKWPRYTLLYFKIELNAPTKPRITRPLEILEASWHPLSNIPVNHSETIDIGLDLAKIKY